jgi:hypothetical protein
MGSGLGRAPTAAVSTGSPAAANSGGASSVQMAALGALSVTHVASTDAAGSVPAAPFIVSDSKYSGSTRASALPRAGRSRATVAVAFGSCFELGIGTGAPSLGRSSTRVGHCASTCVAA